MILMCVQHGPHSLSRRSQWLPTRIVLAKATVRTASTHQGVHNSAQRCVTLTHLLTYNQKTHHGVLENTPRCAGKHINMCKKTYQDVYKLNTPYFYTPFITHL